MIQRKIRLETARRQLVSAESTPEEKDLALRGILAAAGANDPDALVMVSGLLWDGVIRYSGGDSRQRAVEMLNRAAARGSGTARARLDMICAERYRRDFPEGEPRTGPLTDFDGKPIRIDRSGLFVPVDAHLRYENGENVLTFRLNLMILDDEEMAGDAEALRKAIADGIRSWEGRYTVFGGQKLTVRTEITFEVRILDNVVVMVCGGSNEKRLDRAFAALPIKAARANRQSLLKERRSMAVNGLRWSVRSRKFIFLITPSGRFDDREEIVNTIKHEFGHVLGLGDLYAEPDAGLQGVPEKTYPELDGYIVTDRFYHLAMCSSKGPVSNNDIEMVVLAFSRNKMQLYQPQGRRGTVSTALGRGN